MLRIKSNWIISAIATMMCIMTVGWLSCNKSEGSLQRCEGVMCENGGRCWVDTFTQVPKCICPTGYTGANCATAIVDKYIGTWNLRQVIVGSDSPSVVHDTSYYTVTLTRSSTPTAFFINNFADSPNYNQIICRIDSTHNTDFVIDTTSAAHMLFDNYKIFYGYGFIAASGDSILGTYACRHLNRTANRQYDTLQIKLTRH